MVSFAYNSEIELTKVPQSAAHDFHPKLMGEIMLGNSERGATFIGLATN